MKGLANILSAAVISSAVLLGSCSSHSGESYLRDNSSVVPRVVSAGVRTEQGKKDSGSELSFPVTITANHKPSYAYLISPAFGGGITELGRLPVTYSASFGEGLPKHYFIMVCADGYESDAVEINPGSRKEFRIVLKEETDKFKDQTAPSYPFDPWYYSDRVVKVR